MSVKESPCNCGKGTVVVTDEMDDWNRFRTETEIRCPQCRAEHDAIIEERRQNDKKRTELTNSAVVLAKERYLAQWLTLFEGKSTKAAWLTYTGGSGYPALGTFYNHVRERGLTHYVTWCFENDPQKALRIMDTTDPEIEGLLAQADSIPVYRKPHPWQ